MFRVDVATRNPPKCASRRGAVHFFEQHPSERHSCLRHSLGAQWPRIGADMGLQRRFLRGFWGVLGGPEWPLDPLGILRSAGIAFGGAQKPPGSRLGDSWEPPGASQRLHGNLPGAFRETPRSLWGVAKASREHPWSLPRGSQEHLGNRPPFSRLVHIRRWQGNAN